MALWGAAGGRQQGLLWGGSPHSVLPLVAALRGLFRWTMLGRCIICIAHDVTCMTCFGHVASRLHLLCAYCSSCYINLVMACAPLSVTLAALHVQCACLRVLHLPAFIMPYCCCGCACASCILLPVTYVPLCSLNGVSINCRCIAVAFQYVA